MRKGLILFFLIHLNIIGFAQDFPSELWHKGKLVLLSEDTITGKIKYDFQNNIIQIEVRNVLQTYSARKILYFEIFDETIESYRHFYALPYNVQENYQIPLLFEVLYEGQLSLLCREEVVTESVPQNNSYPYYNSYYGRSPYNNQTRARLHYKYYFLDEQGGIQNYNMKKNELLSFFKKRQQQVKQYMKKNNLKHDKMRDLVRLTAYYNALLDS
ncbi:MAG: hypothetical protein KAI29_30360 [Cyclobacteriaceae bacterium]|nr:hypothetical protein [Cyclobacteriaceae bacterium]